MKNNKRNEEEQDITINGSIPKEEITIINVYSSNARTSSHLIQILMDLKGIDSNKIVVGNLYILLVSIHRLIR